MVGKLLYRRLERGDLIDQGVDRFQITLIATAKYFSQKLVDHDLDSVSYPANKMAEQSCGFEHKL
jgi:hypothetical protein